MFERIQKKLTHCIVVKTNSTSRALIVNSALLGAYFFFLSIWKGTEKGIAYIKSMMINYLALEGVQRAKAKVGCLQCCQPKTQGGINLVNPEDPVMASMVKWLELGSSNLHAMLRYRLNLYQLYKGDKWQPRLDFFTIQGH